ncbi:MAG: hypothetical protein K2X07_05495 [Caulobacteraceae bacterium]|nr:hypothetical protein [Caulobacteraceae bacterium]
MRLTLSFAAFAAAAALAGAASAQDPATDGEYRADLIKIIEVAADSRCDADLMGETVLSRCEEQVDQIGPALASLGSIEMITLQDSSGEGTTKVETYDVTFQSGQTLVWTIGDKVDGKYESVGVSG